MTKSKTPVLTFDELTILVRNFVCHTYPYDGIDGVRESNLHVEFAEGCASLTFRNLFRFVPKREDIPTEAELVRAIRTYVRHHFPGFKWCRLYVSDKRSGPGINHPIAPASFVRKGTYRHEW